jgi:hypothetical protein
VRSVPIGTCQGAHKMLIDGIKSTMIPVLTSLGVWYEDNCSIGVYVRRDTCDVFLLSSCL